MRMVGNSCRQRQDNTGTRFRGDTTSQEQVNREKRKSSPLKRLFIRRQESWVQTKGAALYVFRFPRSRFLTLETGKTGRF